MSGKILDYKLLGKSTMIAAEADDDVCPVCGQDFAFKGTVPYLPGHFADLYLCQNGCSCKKVPVDKVTSNSI
jgi:hypothetical protein